MFVVADALVNLAAAGLAIGGVGAARVVGPVVIRVAWRWIRGPVEK